MNPGTPTSDRKTLDGFIRRPGGKAFSSLTKPGRQAASAVHHKLQRSHALMRSVVRNPGGKSAKLSSAAVKEVKLKTRQLPKLVAASVKAPTLVPGPSLERLERAKTTLRHSRVLRFGRPLPSGDSHSKPAPTSSAKTSRAVAVQPVLVTPRLAGATHLNAKPLPSLVTSASHHRLERMLDWALVNADAHKQALHQSTHAHRRLWNRLGWPKWLSLSLISLVVLLAAGFVAYEKVMTVGMQVAKIRSGVQGTMPAYSPAGFKVISPPAYSKGVISLNYKSTDSARRFSISERPSNWDSQSLLENYVRTTGEQYQVSQTSGKTVFTYGTTNATWVDNHIWYVIQNGAELNADEVGKIANSL